MQTVPPLCEATMWRCFLTGSVTESEVAQDAGGLGSFLSSEVFIGKESLQVPLQRQTAEPVAQHSTELLFLLWEPQGTALLPTPLPGCTHLES